MRTACLSFLLLVSLAAADAQRLTPEQLFHQAQQKQQAGDYAGAVADYRAILKDHPELIPARANLGVCLASVGRYDEAIQEYQTALKALPGNPDLRLNLALAYYKAGKLENAAQEFKSLLEEDKSNTRVATLLGDCYLQLHKDAELLNALLPVEKADPDNLAIEWAVGSALIHLGENKEGLQRIDKILKAQPMAEAYALAGEAHLRLEEFKAARENIDTAMKLNPNLPGIHTLDGMVKEYDSDLQAASAAYAQSIQENPNDFQPRMRRGAVLYQLRDLDQAQKELQKALELDPTSAYARFELAKVEKAQGNLDLAVKDLEKVVEQIPQWMKPHVELSALYYRLNRPEDGAREKAIVDRLENEEREKKANLKIISPQTPSQQIPDPQQHP